MEALEDIRKRLRKLDGLPADVKDLRKVCRDMFDHLLSQESRQDRMDRELKNIEARVHLLEDKANGASIG